jgi:hypothetical protein
MQWGYLLRVFDTVSNILRLVAGCIRAENIVGEAYYVSEITFLIG